MSTAGTAMRKRAGNLITWLANAVRADWEAIGRAADRMPLRFSLITVFLLQLLIVVAFGPSFETNDDIFITMIASGKGMSLVPDQHLVFTNVIIGFGLKWLYTIAPVYPWYGCYLFLVHFAAQAAILYATLVIGRDPSALQLRQLAASRGANRSLPNRAGPRLGLYLLYFALVELPLLNKFQFTTTAFLAAQAGIFLWLLAWQRRTVRSDVAVLGPLCVGVALVCLGGLIRLESLAMAVLVAVPLGLFFVKDFSFYAMMPCGLAIVAAAVLVGAAVDFDNSCYDSDPAWHGYRELNQLRGKFHDGAWTYYGAETAPIFAHAGWTANDHAMIARWYSDDPLYNETTLTGIVNSYDWKSSRPMAALWWNAFRDIARNRAVLSVVLALPFVLWFIPGGRQARWAVLASAASAFALIALVIWLKKVPPARVYFPLVSFPLAVALLSFAWRNSVVASSQDASAASVDRVRWWTWTGWRALGWQTQTVIVLLVVAVVMGSYRQVRQSALVHRGRAELVHFLHEDRPEDHKLLVTWEAALPYEFLSPFDNLALLTKVPILSLAWPQRSPCYEAVKQQFGITNLARALFERDDLILVATLEHRALFTEFAKEHFGTELEFVTWRQAGKRTVAGNFRPRAVMQETATAPRSGFDR